LIGQLTGQSQIGTKKGNLPPMPLIYF